MLFSHLTPAGQFTECYIEHLLSVVYSVVSYIAISVVVLLRLSRSSSMAPLLMVSFFLVHGTALMSGAVNVRPDSMQSQ